MGIVSEERSRLELLSSSSSELLESPVLPEAFLRGSGGSGGGWLRAINGHNYWSMPKKKKIHLESQQWIVKCIGAPQALRKMFGNSKTQGSYRLDKIFVHDHFLIFHDHLSVRF